MTCGNGGIESAGEQGEQGRDRKGDEPVRSVWSPFCGRLLGVIFAAGGGFFRKLLSFFSYTVRVVAVMGPAL